MGEQVAVRMTDVAHVISGDLRRSIHVAQRDSMGGIPADSATLAGPRLAIEVGSWLPYACVENNRGGDHRFADIGWSAAEPSFRPTLDRAWREEGL
jgi:hypothetical protein